MGNGRSKADAGSKFIIALLSVVAVSALCIAVWALFFRETGGIIPPDHAPGQTEQNQVPIEGDSGDKLEAEEGGGAVSLTYSDKVQIDLSEGKASLLLANPGRSSHDIVLQIVVSDQLLVMSGRLTPGHRVETLDLEPGAAEKLREGVYTGKFVVLCYDPVSGERAPVNTEIPVSVTVLD